MAAFQFSASNQTASGGNVTGANQAGTVFNLGPGSSTGLNTQHLLIIGGVAVVALLFFMKRRK